MMLLQLVKRIAVIAVLPSVLLGCGDEELNSVSTASGGTYTGVVEAQTLSFRGIPFAKPPVGELRWQAPQAISLSGDYSATEFSSACVQNDGNANWYQSVADNFDGPAGVITTPTISEDCLYLNVWTPTPISPDASLPVMVWIHGGSNVNGWGFEPNYLGTEFAKRGVVLVSINYRLGIFGYFSHPDMKSSQTAQNNFALLDQIAALEWVKGNIEAFGGDVNNVTVFGESAGAANVGSLLAVPQSDGLFHQAISQSGGFQLLDNAMLPDAYAQGESIAAKASTNLEGLRALTHQEVSTLAAEVGDYSPVAGGPTLPLTVAEAADSAQLRSVPLMIGTNLDEWLMYLPAEVTEQDVAEFRATYLADTEAENVDLALAGLTPRQQLDRLTTAQQMLCPSLAFADYNANAAPTYVYRFDRAREHPSNQIGAYHGAEIAYVFNTHDDWLPTSAVDISLSEAMIQYWVNFAYTGNPNGDSLVNWPQLSSGQQAIFDTSVESEVIQRAICDNLITE